MLLEMGRSVRVQQVGETCRGRVGLHVTEGESWGKGDDGGLGYMYGSTRRACGGRLMAVRAVCADAGEDMPEQAQKETRCANAAWLPSGGARVVETYQEMRALERLRDDLRRGACSGCKELLERDLGASEAFFWARAGETGDGM
jgi:hypothetical protein